MKKKCVPTPHNSANKNDFAKTVLMPGDPLRSKYIAEKFLTEPTLVNNVRGVQGYTGYYKGKKISVMAHGMGMPSISIYAHELFKFYDVDNIIRIGTCGSMVKHLNIRDVLLAEFALTSSNIGKSLGHKSKKAECDLNLLNTAKKTIKSLNKNVCIGGVMTSDVFYSNENNSKFIKKGCMAVEMEVYALYAIAKTHNKHALGILTISDNITTGEKTSAEERQSSFDDMIISALETAIKL